MWPFVLGSIYVERLFMQPRWHCGRPLCPRLKASDLGRLRRLLTLNRRARPSVRAAVATCFIRFRFRSIFLTASFIPFGSPSSEKGVWQLAPPPPLPPPISLPSLCSIIHAELYHTRTHISVRAALCKCVCRVLAVIFSGGFVSGGTGDWQRRRWN